MSNGRLKTYFCCTHYFDTEKNNCSETIHHDQRAHDPFTQANGYKTTKFVEKQILDSEIWLFQGHQYVVLNKRISVRDNHL
jgi:hypothetical protein